MQVYRPVTQIGDVHISAAIEQYIYYHAKYVCLSMASFLPQVKFHWQWFPNNSQVTPVQNVSGYPQRYHYLTWHMVLTPGMLPQGGQHLQIERDHVS